MTFAFIFNPKSSSSNHSQHLANIQKTHPHAPVLLSQSIADTKDFIQKHSDISIFVACGGDGTIASVAQELIGTHKILACLPLGSGNGFAKENGFSPNLEALFAQLKQGNSRYIDSISINNRLCINVAGTGFDAQVVKAFEKTSRGFINYIKCSMAQFFRYKNIAISTDEKKWESYFMLNIANTRQFGNDAYISPQSKINDGLFELVALKRPKIGQIPSLIYRLFSQKLKDADYIKFSSHQHLTLYTQNTDWQIDGEHCQLISPIEIKIQANSLRVLV